MDPVLALRRIAFLLERGQAATYRVAAFRTAAGTLANLAPTELARRFDKHTLTELPGIGPKTAAAAYQAHAGQTPDYLVDLEAAVEPLATGGEVLRVSVRGDLHVHSDWSDGGSPIEEMVDAAGSLGHDYVALTDHSPRLTVARGLTAERLTEQLDVVAGLADSDGGIRVLSGIECDINIDGTLDQTPELLSRLDVVVASVHSDLRAGIGAMTRRMLAAVANPHTAILGHCTGRLIAGGRGSRPESRFNAERVFAACAENGVAVEINCRPERLDPPRRLLRIALGAGCLFAIDTDAHAPGELDWLDYGCARAAECGVPAERVVNSWDFPSLLDWLHRER